MLNRNSGLAIRKGLSEKKCMKNNIKPAFLLFFLFFLINQNYDIQGQNNIPELLRQRFQSYIEAVPMEEVFIHTDRDDYISGEDLWFAVYLIDRQSHKPSAASRIAYFELINSENRPVVQKRIYLENGFGPGQINLPDTLSSGIYTIRAYTNRMKNFLPYDCFVRDIRIFNPFNNKRFKGRSGDATISDERITEQAGSGTLNTGMTLKINSINPDNIEIIFTADEKYRSENNNLFYLFIQTHGIIDHVSNERITGEEKKVLIPVKSLTGGLNQITVFDSKGQPVCSKFNYTPSQDTPAISVNPKDSYGVREKVTVELEISNSIINKLKSWNISVSVSPLTAGSLRADMNGYLMFGSESGLNKSVLSSKKISDIPQGIMDSILLKIKSKWIDWPIILSGKIPGSVYETEREFHSLRGKLTEGDKPLSSSSEYVLLCMPGKEPGFQYAKTDSAGNFSFNIHIDDSIKDLVLMPDDESRMQKIILESGFAEQYAPVRMASGNDQVSIPQYINDWSVNYQIRKIYGVSSSTGPVESVLPPLKPVRFYGKPDIELIMADYVTLPEMGEVFYELLPHVSMKKRDSGYEILITDRINENRYETSPDLFLDGVKINNASMIVKLDPSIVERIDVIKEKYFVGNYSFPGLLNITTQSADFSTVQLPGYMIRLPYRVTEPVKSFFSPDYSSSDLKNSTIPDFRNTLYWNPSVKPDSEGKVRIEFWTSDFVSEYEINVQGITSEGKVISARKSFRVE
jgi:hypothetical protein